MKKSFDVTLLRNYGSPYTVGIDGQIEIRYGSSWSIGWRHPMNLKSVSCIQGT
ncbi:MAG: hypothetical protein R3C12_16415 [Planctomycetaceae bacterium]